MWFGDFLTVRNRHENANRRSGGHRLVLAEESAYAIKRVPNGESGEGSGTMSTAVPSGSFIPRPAPRAVAPGACPSATTPSPVALAEVPAFDPCPVGSPRVSQSATSIAASVKARCRLLAGSTIYPRPRGAHVGTNRGAYVPSVLQEET